MTLLSITSNHGNVVAASANLLGWRCLSGWVYGLLDGVHAGVNKMIAQRFQKEQEEKDLQRANTEMASMIKRLQAQITELEQQKTVKPAKARNQQAAAAEEVRDDKLARAQKFFEENPELLHDDAADEKLAEYLGLRRPASARFWRLKVKELKGEMDVPNKPVIPTTPQPDVVVEIEATSGELPQDQGDQGNQGQDEEEIHTDHEIEAVSNVFPISRSNGADIKKAWEEGLNVKEICAKFNCNERKAYRWQPEHLKKKKVAVNN
jgi:hypothetical protein